MTSSKTRSLVAAVSIVALLAACAPQNKETIVSWDQVPAPVQATMTKNAHGHKIAKIEKEEEAGKPIYEARVYYNDGSRRIIKVADSGDLVAVKKRSAEKVVAWNKVPAAVQHTITAEAKDQKVTKVVKAVDDGKLVYEAAVENKDGSQLMIRVDKKGKLLKTKTLES